MPNSMTTLNCDFVTRWRSYRGHQGAGSLLWVFLLRSDLRRFPRVSFEFGARYNGVVGTLDRGAHTSRGLFHSGVGVADRR